MTISFERFTDRARKVMMIANRHAVQHQSASVSTLHVLLGLAEEGVGIAANVLKNLGVGLDDLKTFANVRAVRSIGVETLVKWAEGQKVPRSAKVDEVLHAAVKAAGELGHNYVDTEHVLLGLCRVEEDEHTRQFQETFKVKPEEIVEEIHSLLGTKKTDPEEFEDAYLTCPAVVASRRHIVQFETPRPLTDEQIDATARFIADLQEKDECQK